jgi:hypothetical protein
MFILLPSPSFPACFSSPCLLVSLFAYHLAFLFLVYVALNNLLPLDLNVISPSLPLLTLDVFRIPCHFSAINRLPHNS